MGRRAVTVACRGETLEQSVILVEHKDRQQEEAENVEEATAAAAVADELSSDKAGDED